VSNRPELASESISEIIQMVLRDEVSFAAIKELHGSSEDQVKAIMRSNLKPSSYRTWRRPVRSFPDRSFYKSSFERSFEGAKRNRAGHRDDERSGED
jgi:uncharacterized protein (TIGR03643 family)